MKLFLFFGLSFLSLYAHAQNQVEKEVLAKLNSIHYPVPILFEVFSCDAKLSGKASMEVIWHGDNAEDDGQVPLVNLVSEFFTLVYGEVLSNYPIYDHVIITFQKSKEHKKIKTDFYIIGKDILRVEESGKITPIAISRNQNKL